MLSESVVRHRPPTGSQPIISGLDITNLRDSVERAFQLGNIADVAATGLGKVVGDATVTSIRGRITDALSGDLPPELIDALEKGPREFEKYVARARKYLPGEALNRLKNSVLNRPIIKLPTPTYAAMLAGSAAGHFARAFQGAVAVSQVLPAGT